MKYFFFLVTVVSVTWFGTSCGGTSPAEVLYSITGYVVLTGTGTDSTATPTGELEVTDADGVKVDLLNSASEVVSTAHTSGGQYTFKDLSAGEYRGVALVADISGDTTSIMTVSDSNIQSPDTLTLHSSGFILAFKNPFDDAVTLRFTQSASDSATLNILGADQSVVRHLKNQFLDPGEYGIVWNGAYDDSSSADPGSYWAVYRSGNAEENELVVKR